MNRIILFIYFDREGAHKHHRNSFDLLCFSLIIAAFFRTFFCLTYHRYSVLMASFLLRSLARNFKTHEKATCLLKSSVISTISSHENQVRQGRLSNEGVIRTLLFLFSSHSRFISSTAKTY